MKIFLIRHGESICNTEENFTLGLPDHKVYLTDKGKQQAHNSAQNGQLCCSIASLIAWIPSGELPTKVFPSQ